MRVTDAVGILQMVLDGRISGRISEWPQLRPAIQSAVAALSHAAGQEATTNPAEIGRKSVGGEAVAWRYRYYDSDGWTYKSRRPNDPPPGNPDGKVIEALYLTPAQPPASAEVGRDAARYRWWRENCAFSSWQGDVKVHHDLDMSLGADIDGCRSNMDAAIDAAMAAPSGPIAGVTHGTDEGWGDE